MRLRRAFSILPLHAAHVSRSNAIMWVKQITLCLCAATLATAVPVIKSKQLIIESHPSIIDSVSDISATRFAEDMEAETKIPLSRDDDSGRLEKVLISASMDKVEVFGSDKIKTRIRRDIFRVKCPVGEIKIHGRCMSCEEMGMC